MIHKQRNINDLLFRSDVVLSGLYEIFRNDFINGNPYFGNSPVFWDKRVLPGEKYEEGFWHLISRDDPKIQERTFDPRRAERLPWCRPVIINHDDRSVVKVWDFKEGSGRIRTYLWLEKWDYVVILEKRKQKIGVIGFLITAFYVDGDKRRANLREKYLKRIA